MEAPSPPSSGYAIALNNGLPSDSLLRSRFQARHATQREERWVTSLKTAAKETKLQKNTLIMTLDVRYDPISFGDYLKCNFLTTL